MKTIHHQEDGTSIRFVMEDESCGVFIGLRVVADDPTPVLREAIRGVIKLCEPK